LRASRIPFTSPNKPNINQSPLKYAGANVVRSGSSSKSESPQTAQTTNSGLNPRERMEQRKRAKADERAKLLKQANKVDFHQNKLIAKQNKLKTTGIPRAASLEDYHLNLKHDEITKYDEDALSEPPLENMKNMKNMNNMNDMNMAIDTIQEKTEYEEEEEEDEIIQDEIDELKQTLKEHTMQIQQIKNSILLKRKELINSDDIEQDAENVNDGDDVETLLNAQEQNMKTINLQKLNLNENEPVYKEIKSPNNIDATYHQRQFVEISDDESSEEMPIGRLVERIEFIKRKCIEGMGLDGFKMIYHEMKQIQYEDKKIDDIKIKQQCHDSNVSKSRVRKYRSLIDQLLFIEANCC